MKKIILSIYSYFERKPLVMWGSLFCILLLCILSALRLNFVEDISNFLPNNGQNERINYAYEHLGGDNKLIISISQKDTLQTTDLDLLSSSVDQFVEQLQKLDTNQLIKSLLYHIDEEEITDITNFVIENMPYFLTEEDYARMDTLICEENMQQQLQNNKLLLSSPMPLMRHIIQRDPLFFSSSILQALNTFSLDSNYRTEDGYLFRHNGQEAIVIVTSNYPLSETKNNAQLIEHINTSANAVMHAKENKVNIHSFGASQISLSNARQIKKDSVVALGLALIFILALLLYYYQNIRSLLLIFLSTLFGALFALGIISLLKPTVSLIALGVASIIIGIAINYPIHVLSHFKRTDDKEQIIKDIVTPLLIGNITTVGAFLSLLFISSPAMKDLGLFAALLLIGTIFFVLLFLPHLMGKHFQGKTRTLTFRHIAECRPEKIKGLFLSILSITFVLFFFSKQTTFDTNMQHINYMTEEQKKDFEQLRANIDTSLTTIYCIAEGNNLQNALLQHEKLNDTLQQLSTQLFIQNCSGIGYFIPSRSLQEKKIQRWNQFWDNKRELFLTLLDKTSLQNGFNPDAFLSCKEIILKSYSVQSPDYFAPLKQKLALNYISEDNDKTLIYTILSLKKEDANTAEEALNSISHNVFAFTDQSIASRLVTDLSHDFDYVLYLCGFIVFAFLLFTFGRLEISFLAFLPLFIAWIWILGIMGITGTTFNIVNIILATFIFGMGDDYAIFVTEGLIHEHAYGRKMLAQFKNSIILSALIMFLGIGMLIFAKHPAMKSLAKVTIIGMFSVVLMAYIVPPILFQWITTRKGRVRQQPVTFKSLFRSAIGFPYFFCGVVILSVMGFFWLRLCKRTDKNKLKYHQLLKKLMESTAHNIPKTTYRILNPYHENFEKPAVILCNHQSHFDLLYTLSLYPKIIVLTNDWAWNTPLYRRILRNADYLPVSFGMNQNLPKIKAMVDKGYSVLVFPEGTRSVDQNILRFHQGAFAIAKQLELDILPIIMHGVGDIFPKHDTCIHEGTVTLSIHPRISPNDPTFRNNKSLLETTRLLRHYYIHHYALLKEKSETPTYLKNIVFHNYIYKGKEVQRTCKQKLSQLSTLVEALAKLPAEGRLLYKNCGQGELSLLTALWQKKMHITAYDPNNDNIDLAAHCHSVPSNLHYTNQLPDTTPFDYIIDEQELLTSVQKNAKQH